MLVIGLTGNFGTGKTTVAEILARSGVTVIDADQTGHEVLQSSSTAYHEVVAAFGKSILGPDQEVDRSKLGQIVFADTAALNQLNQIMHPKMYIAAQEKIGRYEKQGVKVVVIEAALLIEVGWASLVDRIWVTTAPHAVIVDRLKNRRGFSEEQILARLQSQMPQEEKIRHADVIIDTDCQIQELAVKVTQLLPKLQT